MSVQKLPLEPGEVYHIWTHANGNDNLFREERNYAFFLNKYIHYINPIADTFAYCLMPNHLHLMVRLKSEEELVEAIKKKNSLSTTKNLQSFEDLTGFENLSGLLSKQFSNLFNAYTKSFNKTYNRRGSLFERPFKRKQITSEEYFLRLLAYIHLNPVHHGFAKHPDAWKHSSWHAYFLNKQTHLHVDTVFEWSGGKDAFIKLHEDVRMEALKRIFESED